MARVLHLLDHEPDYQTHTALDQLNRDAAATVCTVGRGGDFATPLLGILNLRHYTESFDLIHAWGEPALTIAAMGSRKRIIFSPTQFPGRREVGWLRAVMSGRDVHVVCPTDTMRRAFVERGVPIARCHIVRPGVELAKVQPRRNDELRTQLGFARGDFVFLAAGESIRGANHHATILACAVLNLFDPAFKLLVWGRGPMANKERGYAAKMLPENFAAFATDRLGREASYEQLFQATDGVMITADGPVPPLPIAVSMAAGLPIIAAVSETISELLEDRHNCLMVGGCTSRTLAQRVLDLREDPQLQWRISDAARTDAYEFFSMSRFVSQLRTVYDQVAAGQPVELAPVQPGAGSRFLGRV